MKILSLQSWVASGHVGNAAAIFPLQRLGAEVLAIHTVQFSNHPGHGAYTGRALPAAEIAALVEGLAAHGALRGCDAVLSGYLGEAPIGDAVLDAASRVRAANPAALWCCDPVMGDNGALYVKPDIPEFFAVRALPCADILTPNQFELECLAGRPCVTVAASRDAARDVRARMRAEGPRVLLVSSLRTEETPPDALDMLLCCAQAKKPLRAPLLPGTFSGAGDTLAALFLFHMLDTQDAVRAAGRAASSMAGLLARTRRSGARELLSVAAQDEFIRPHAEIVAVRC